MGGAAPGVAAGVIPGKVVSMTPDNVIPAPDDNAPVPTDDAPDVIDTVIHGGDVPAPGEDAPALISMTSAVVIDLSSSRRLPSFSCRLPCICTRWRSASTIGTSSGAWLQPAAL